jgi:hypothetical protein
MNLILFNLLLTNGFSQEIIFQKPDYSGIEKIITNKESEFFYPTLFKRYLDSDTALTVREYRVLYYGYLFNESYTPSVSYKYIDSLNSVLDKKELDLVDYKEIIRYENLILKKFPFNLNDLNLLAYAYSQIGDTVSYKQAINKYYLLFETILSTGDGTTEEKAYNVISISHEYDILEGLGLKFGTRQTLTDNGYDYLEVLENKKNIRGIYFDVNMILDKRIKDTGKDLEPLWLLDGVQLYSNEETKNIEMRNISININKQEVIDCYGQAIYGGLIQVTSNDSMNLGLKYILKKTKNWIFIHPLADYEINGVVVNKDITLKTELFKIKPEMIKEIEIVEPDSILANCSNGMIKIKTK